MKIFKITIEVKIAVPTLATKDSLDVAKRYAKLMKSVVKPIAQFYSPHNWKISNSVVRVPNCEKCQDIGWYPQCNVPEFEDDMITPCYQCGMKATTPNPFQGKK